MSERPTVTKQQLLVAIDGLNDLNERVERYSRKRSASLADAEAALLAFVAPDTPDHFWGGQTEYELVPVGSVPTREQIAEVVSDFVPERATCPDCRGAGSLIVATCRCGRAEHAGHWEEIEHADCGGTGIIEVSLGALADAVLALWEGEQG